MDKTFTALHVHTTYGSILDSIITPKDLVKTAKSNGCAAVAVTDHGSMASAIMVYKECVKNDIKPIIGLEAYITPDISVRDSSSRYNHLILLAKDRTGYENLMKLSSVGYTQGMYFKPRIDYSILETYKGGLICMSACIQGEISQAIINGEDPKPYIDRYKKWFGDDFYLEVQSHVNEEQISVNHKIAELSEKYGIPLVVTTDAHYLNKEDFEAHGVYIRISQDRDTSNYSDCYFQTYDEMYEKLSKSLPWNVVQEALSNTNVVAEKCNLEIELGCPYLPHPKNIPDGKTEYEALLDIVRSGVKTRGILSYSNKIEYINRLNFELNVIHTKGFDGYFLNLKHLLDLGREKKIPFGDGRGSAGGSLVAYCMYITNVDPIKYDLDFGRFLTMERTELPDKQYCLA